MSTPSFLSETDKEHLSEIDTSINTAIELLENRKKKIADPVLMKNMKDKLKPADFELFKKQDEEYISTLTQTLDVLNELRERHLERGESTSIFGHGGKKMRKTKKTIIKRNKKRRSSIRSD